MNSWKIAATKITMENHWNLQKIARKKHNENMKNLTLKSKQKISQTEVLHLYRWFTHTHTKQRERKQEVKKAEQTSTTAKKHVI